MLGVLHLDDTRCTWVGNLSTHLTSSSLESWSVWGCSSFQVDVLCFPVTWPSAVPMNGRHCVDVWLHEPVVTLQIPYCSPSMSLCPRSIAAVLCSHDSSGMSLCCRTPMGRLVLFSRIFWAVPALYFLSKWTSRAFGQITSPQSDFDW